MYEKITAIKYMLRMTVATEPNVVWRNQDPSAESCFAHYFLGRHWGYNLFQRKKCMVLKVGYTKVGYEGFHCTITTLILAIQYFAEYENSWCLVFVMVSLINITFLLTHDICFNL